MDDLCSWWIHVISMRVSDKRIIGYVYKDFKENKEAFGLKKRIMG